MKQNNLHSIATLLRAMVGLDGYIAGGAVRDSLFGTQAKDLDFVIPNLFWDEKMVFDKMTRLSRHLAEAEYSSQVYQAYGESDEEGYENSGKDFSDMFLGCMKVQFEGHDIDILFSRYKTIEEHVKHHDCNINSVWLDKDGMYQGETDITQPLSFIRDVGQGRKQYMMAKYANLCALAGQEAVYDL